MHLVVNAFRHGTKHSITLAGHVVPEPGAKPIAHAVVHCPPIGADMGRASQLLRAQLPHCQTFEVHAPRAALRIPEKRETYAGQVEAAVMQGGELVNVAARITMLREEWGCASWLDDRLAEGELSPEEFLDVLGL